MAKLQLSLANIGQIDLGKIQAAFDVEVRRCLGDCEDRPADRTPRVVSLNLSITPVGDGAACELAEAEFTMTSKVPPRRSKPYQVSIRKTARGVVGVFNDESPEDARQGTLDELNSEMDAANAKK